MTAIAQANAAPAFLAGQRSLHTTLNSLSRQTQYNVYFDQP